MRLHGGVHRRVKRKGQCVVATCENDAEVGPRCGNCYKNHWYHSSKGPVHVAVWIQKVKLKVARAQYLEEEL